MSIRENIVIKPQPKKHCLRNSEIVSLCKSVKKKNHLVIRTATISNASMHSDQPQVRPMGEDRPDFGQPR
jgi:hypothetical protein